MRYFTQCNDWFVCFVWYRLFEKKFNRKKEKFYIEMFILKMMKNTTNDFKNKRFE